MINIDVELVAAVAIVCVAFKIEKETKEETRNMDKTKPLMLNSAANDPKVAFRIFLFLYSSQNVFHSDSTARKEFINFSVSILKLFCLDRNIYIYTPMIRK